MSSASVKAAVRGHLAAHWDPAAAAIREANSDFQPGGRPWFELRFPGSRTERQDIGEPDHPLWRETGAFMVDVYVPQGIGADAAEQLGEQVAALFLGRSIDGVECQERLDGVAGEREPAGVPGPWWGLSFGIGYRFQWLG
jgi:hypothetical protein